MINQVSILKTRTPGIANPSLKHKYGGMTTYKYNRNNKYEGLKIHGIGNTCTSNPAINPWARATFKQKLPLYSTSNDPVSNGFSYFKDSWNFSLLLISLERYIFLYSFYPRESERLNSGWQEE